MIELHLPTDYADLLRAFLREQVEFVLIGGWAVAAHGHGRATDDLDIFVRASAGNARRVLAALERFGAPLAAHGVTEELFVQPRYGYRMGRKPLLIEILTRIDGVTFDEAIEHVIEVDVQGLRVPVIGRVALLENKRAAGRPKDLADLAALGDQEPGPGA
jgi:predicted nucleotidyltransferase